MVMPSRFSNSMSNPTERAGDEVQQQSPTSERITDDHHQYHAKQERCRGYKPCPRRKRPAVALAIVDRARWLVMLPRISAVGTPALRHSIGMMALLM
jgi:hypothetical protein